MSCLTNGRKVSKRTSQLYVVLDTCVAIRALGERSQYHQLREAIVKKCDVIASSREIVKEWDGKAGKTGMTALILRRKMQELKDIRKITIVEKSRLQLVELERAADDKYDNKFLTVGMAVKAGCIISTDHRLLQLDPYKYDQTQMRIVRPNEYPTDVQQ